MQSSITATVDASSPAETPVAPEPTTATPQQAFSLVNAGVVAGMPVPLGVTIQHNYQTITIKLIDDFPGGVWQWVNYLCLPNPVADREPIESGGWFVTFESEATKWMYAGLPGWTVRVRTFMNVDAPAWAAEQAAAVTA